MEGLKQLNTQQALDELEERLKILEKKVLACAEYIESLKVENQKLRSDADNLEEENKRLQGLVKRYSQLQSRTEIARSKLRKLIERISGAA
jgi:predicted nuclease with TOPRIM domain